MLEEKTNDPLEWTADDEAALQATATQEPAGDDPADPPQEAAETVSQVAEVDDEDDADDDAPEANKRPGFVPHRKLQKQIERRQKVEQELTKEREERVRLEERTNLLLQRFQQPEQAPKAQETVQEPPPPSVEEDIFGWGNHTGKRVETLEQRLDRLERERQHDGVVNQVKSAVTASEATFRQQNPDYDDACKFLFESRQAELEVFGINPVQAQQHIAGEFLRISQQALQTGKSPAQIAYEWARKRGYAKKDPDPAPSAVADEARESAAERIARTADAQARSRSLGSGGGSGGPESLDARKLARMSEDDFAKIMDSPEVRKLMGG